MNMFYRVILFVLVVGFLLAMVVLPGRPLWLPVVMVGVRPVPTATATPGVSAVRIVTIGYEGRDEFVWIRNDGSGAQSMGGWMLQSYRSADCRPELTQRFWFPDGFVLGPGASVWIHSGPEASSGWPLHLYWTRDYVWANAGDVGDLRDAGGGLVGQFRYGVCAGG